MSQTTLCLDKPKIFIIRELSARNASNQELATKGLAIGNDLDNNDSDDFHWKTESDGTLSRYYRIPEGKWPVYLTTSEQQLFKRHFSREHNDGDVIYVAEIDIQKLRLGTNVAFERTFTGEISLKMPATTLTAKKSSEGKFYLVSDIPKTELQPSLAYAFDAENRLMVNEVFGGEFYLDNYEKPQDLENERIFRFEGGKPKEITEKVRRLRELEELKIRILGEKRGGKIC